jgi:hypothetical protein
MPHAGCLEAEFGILVEFVTKDGWMDGWLIHEPNLFSKMLKQDSQKST